MSADVLASVKATLATATPVELAYGVAESGLMALTAKATIGGLLFQLEVKAPCPLTCMPTIRVVRPTKVEGLCHVNYEGIVCYSDHEGEGFDLWNPALVISYALSRSIAVLEESVERKRSSDFGPLFDEFEGYWHSLPGSYPVSLHDCPAGSRLYARVQAVPSKPSLMLSISSNIRAGNQTIRKTPFFDLASPILPPAPKSSFEIWLPRLLEHAGEKAKELARQPSEHFFLFRQPRPSGSAIFGVQFRTARNQKRGFSFRHVFPFYVERCWRQYLLDRTGAKEAKKTVAIVGCGAVGSRVADQLALCGVQRLVLIDHEKMKHENAYRHILGSNQAGQYKVKALSHELTSKRPGLVVDTQPVKVESMLSRSKLFDGLDCVVLATGNLSLERYITRLAFEQGRAVTLISGWVEPVGLGGHAVASRPGVNGCLECLHTNIEGGSQATVRTAFLCPDQKFSRNLTGCGGAFTPYTALDATKTATTICELVMSGEVGYRCWIGGSSEADRLDLKTTNFYQTMKASGAARLQGIFQKGCACCDM